MCDLLNVLFTVSSKVSFVTTYRIYTREFWETSEHCFPSLFVIFLQRCITCTIHFLRARIFAKFFFFPSNAIYRAFVVLFLTTIFASTLLINFFENAFTLYRLQGCILCFKYRVQLVKGVVWSKRCKFFDKPPIEDTVIDICELDKNVRRE